MKKPKHQYTTEFTELAVQRVKDGMTAGAAAKELGLVEQTLRNWVKAASANTLNGAGAKVVTSEQIELSRLRAEIVRLKRENEILKKATVDSGDQRNTICGVLERGGHSHRSQAVALGIDAGGARRNFAWHGDGFFNPADRGHVRASAVDRQP